MRKISLLGGISVGKGFCMKYLKQTHPGMPQIIMGDYFRGLRKLDPAFEAEYGHVMDNGELLEDSLVTRHALILLWQISAQFIGTDGMFRTGKQVRDIANRKLIGPGDIFCVLNASFSTCHERHLHRIKNNPGGPRSDEKWFKERTKLYHDNFDGVMRAIRETGAKIYQVDADRPLGEVAVDISTYAEHFTKSALDFHHNIPTSRTKPKSLAFA